VLESAVHGFAGAVVADVELDAAGEVLHGGEGGLAHDALEHDAAGDADVDRLRLQFLATLAAVELVELVGGVFAQEVVGEGDALGAQLRQLLAALGNDLVFVLGLLDGFGHDAAFRKNRIR
jgi:hypothetical protein